MFIPQAPCVFYWPRGPCRGEEEGEACGKGGQVQTEASMGLGNSTWRTRESKRLPATSMEVIQGLGGAGEQPGQDKLGPPQTGSPLASQSQGLAQAGVSRLME